MWSKIPTIADIRDLLGPPLADCGADKAVVFGSYARGDADERSDLDMIVVSDTDKRFLQRIEDYWPVFRAWWTLRKSFDPLVYTPEEIARMQARGNPFIRKALSEGVVIYERRSSSGGRRAHSTAAVATAPARPAPRTLPAQPRRRP